MAAEAINRDWTRGATPFDTDFQRFTRDHVDWHASPLGPIEGWSPDLRQNVRFCIADPRPSVVVWGQGADAAIVYNEAYTGVLGARHATMQGQPYSTCWPEILTIAGKDPRAQCETRNTFVDDRVPRLLMRNGSLEECYMSYTSIPLFASDTGHQLGLYINVVEVTAEVLLERRMKTIQALHCEINKVESRASLWKAIMTGLAVNEVDLPLVLLYSSGSDKSATLSHQPNGTHYRLPCRLEGVYGVEEGHRIAPHCFDLYRDSYELASAIRRTAEQHSPVIVQESDHTLPTSIFSCIKWRGHGVECGSAILCAIRSGHEQSSIGFLIIGINSRRPFDSAYAEFIRLLVEQVITPHVSNILLREENEAARAAAQVAALERIRLNEEMVARTVKFEQSEPTFVKIASEIPFGIGVADLQGNVLYGNALWRRYTGIAEDSPERLDFAKCALPDQEAFIRSLRSDLLAGTPVNSYLRLKTPWISPDGHEHPTTARVTAFTSVDCEGKMTIVSSMVDVSDLKWVEALLQQRTTELDHSVKKYRRFADMAPVGLAVLSQDRLLQFTNHAFDRIMAPASPSVDILDCVYDEDVDTFRDCLARVSGTQRYVSCECRLRKRVTQDDHHGWDQPTNDTRTWILASVYLEETPHTRIMCWVTDITAQKTAQDIIQKRMDEALEMKRQQERFIDMTSHEIRNPLSAMIHCTDEIVENSKKDAAGLAEETLEAAYTIDYCAKHIRTIVGDVLTLSKLDSKLVDICPGPVQPQEMMSKIMRVFTGEARSSGVTLQYSEDGTISDLGIDWVVLDRQRFAQVLVNLITNAVKFTKLRSERKVFIRLSASREPPSAPSDGVSYVPSKHLKPVPFRHPWSQSASVYLIASVEDTGLGIGEEERKILFQRFKQASPKTETQYGGSGLGLFICRDLTELQGGRIGVSSVPGVGSKFVFYVEAKLATAPELQPDMKLPDLPHYLPEHSPNPTEMLSGRRSRRSPNSTDAQVQNPGARRILVVEDNLINSKVLAHQLRKRGCEVSTAIHGEEALRTIRARSANHKDATARPSTAFHVVLMDIEMPVMDGITCMKEIRAMESQGELSERLPIIAVTANVREELTKTVTAAGADAITTKPYRVNELLAQIEKVIPSEKG